MGQSIKISCNKCKTEKIYNLGCGFRDNNKEVMISRFPEELKPACETILNSTSDKGFRTEMCLGICKACKKIEAFPTLFKGTQVKLEGKCSCTKAYDLKYRLSELTDLDENKEIKCPVCGDELTVTVTGFWD